MATYSFKVSKGKYVLELDTTDKEMLVEQFALWVQDAGAYAKYAKYKEHKDMVNSRIRREEELTKKNIEKQIKSGRDVEPVEEKEPEAVAENPIVEEASQDDAKQKEEALDIFYAPQTPAKTVSEIEKEAPKTGVFDNILEQSMNNPQTELSFKTSPSIKKDSAYLNYMATRKIEKKIDYLLNTAYYFTQYEQRARFTLKQLNTKLMQNLAVIIDHSVLQEAINRDYIECLPDLTGLVGASEYRLTAYGEKTLMEE